jgi:hypothetical protein
MQSRRVGTGRVGSGRGGPGACGTVAGAYGEFVSSNEERVSGNEEFVSSNEEFVGSNEEFVSSNEELVSSNEELVSAYGTPRACCEAEKKTPARAWLLGYRGFVRAYGRLVRAYRPVVRVAGNLVGAPGTFVRSGWKSHSADGIRLAVPGNPLRAYAGRRVVPPPCVGTARTRLYADMLLPDSISHRLPRGKGRDHTLADRVFFLAIKYSAPSRFGGPNPIISRLSFCGIPDAPSPIKFLACEISYTPAPIPPIVHQRSDA